MKKIQQVNELSALLQDLHGVEVTPCELLELEDYNYALAHQRSGQLATSDLCEITCDIGKAIGFIVGAVLGAFILPGLGFGITGWFAGAVAGGALGYRLVSLFDGSQGSGQRTDVTDSSTRFSGTGQLGQLGSIIPIIYGNKDVNPDGGVVVRDPTIIYSRISAGLGVQYIERLSLLTIGKVGRVNVNATLFNDQRMPELNRSIEVNKGASPQNALGNINHYSQSIALSVNNKLGLRRLLAVGQPGARGAANTATNLVGCTGTGTATISKTANTTGWTAGFTSAALTVVQAFGNYMFSRSTIGGTTPIEMAIGFSLAANAAGTTLDTMTMAYVVNSTSWSLQSAGVPIASGLTSLAVSGAVVEVRAWYSGTSTSWVQLIIGTVEVSREQFPGNLVGTALLPDFGFNSPLASLATRTAGVVGSVAGAVEPGIGQRLYVATASVPKLVVGKTYDGAGTNFTITNIDTGGSLPFIEVSPSAWAADIDITQAAGAVINALGSFCESYTATYRTSIQVQTIELLLTYSIWGKTSANAPSAYAQAFRLEAKEVSAVAWTRIGVYLLEGDTELVKTVTIIFTGLTLAFYEIRLIPLDASSIITTVELLQPGILPVAGAAITINGSTTANTITERKQILTIAEAKTKLNNQPTIQSTERGASIQISQCNEIVNPFGKLTAGVSSVAVGNGTGIKGEYYSIKADNTRDVLLGTRIDATVGYNITQPALPFPAFNKNRYGIVWTGTIIPRYTAVYTFEATYDDTCLLVINDQSLVIYNAPAVSSASISFVAGVEYAIRAETINTGTNGYFGLKWSSVQVAKEVVPVQQLRPLAPTVSAAIPAPTYPGYLIARTKLTSSDQLSSAPSEAYDVELGAVIRQYLAFVVATTASTNGDITDNTGPFSSSILAVGDIAQVIGKGSMVVTPGAGNITLTCQSYIGSVFAATTDSLLVFDYALWLNALPGMTLTAAGIPAGTTVGEVLPNNRIRLADRWGRELKATIPTGNVEMNKSVPIATGDEIVVYRMGSSCYFPDCYVDRLINPISGLGNYIDENQFIDYKSIVAARAYCVANKFFFDGRIGDGTFEAWAIQTAPSSLLFATEIKGRYGLLIQGASKPSYLFNDSNCDYTEPGIPFDQQLTNTLLVGYQDRLGKAKQLKIQTNAANNGTNLEIVKTISAPGVTSQAQAIKVGQVALKSLMVQSSVCTITTDIAVGLYCQQGDIVRTQHRAIEYSDESSGFVMSAGTTSNSRTATRAVAIDRIEGFQLSSLTRLELTPSPVNPRRTTDTLTIAGNSDSGNNVALNIANVGLLDDYRISTVLTASGTGGTLTIGRTIIDQEVTLSEPITLTANSRFICTHRGTRTTESDLLVQLVSGTTYKIIGLQEPLAIGDAWAIGVQSSYYKTWRLSSVQPDVAANKVTFSGVAWTDDILSPSGLVTVNS